MEHHRGYGKENIFSALIEIYHDSSDQDVRLWCRIAMRMAMNMYQALKDYQKMLEEKNQIVDFSWAIKTDSSVKPYRVINMERARNHGINNACSTIRNIWLSCREGEMETLCRRCMRSSKNMYDALTDYKSKLVELGMGVGHDYREDWQLRRKEIYRKE